MTGSVPLVLGDTGGKRSRIRTDPSTHGVRLWAPACAEKGTALV